jgi:TPR repeat protein
MLLPLVEVFLVPLEMIRRGDRIAEQKGELLITYGPDDKVVRIENTAKRDLRELHEELSVVQTGATRDQVEAVLGKPDYSESEGDATVQVYRQLRQSAHVVMYVTYGPGSKVLRAETATQWRDRNRKALREDLSVVRIGATREQVEDVLGESESGGDAAVQKYSHRRGGAADTVYVTYGADGTVTRFGKPSEYREEKKRQEMADLLAKARCGDAHAQFQIGNRYRHGARGLSADRIEAARWLGLASGRGHEDAATSLARLQQYLTPGQIVEAERLIAEWQPQDCSDAAHMVTTEEVIENR